ncbi:MAG: NUDIX domain-containing protein [Sphingobacteriaceae bacterium]|nr:NUDIX domain-containing protein [Sphingobacteriaceae bacterium]
MNKKIYFNNKIIVIQHPNELSALSPKTNIYNQTHHQSLDHFLQNFLNEKVSDSTIQKIYSIPDSAFENTLNFFKKFHYIEAGGGLIQKEKEYLFIRRLGKWDLPKGKLDKGESIEACALRECEEECNVKNLKIIARLPSTFHIYKYKNSYALKRTYWFHMVTNYTGKLVPQTEENIEAVEWMDKKKIKQFVLPDTYPTIVDLINDTLNLID